VKVVYIYTEKFTNDPNRPQRVYDTSPIHQQLSNRRPHHTRTTVPDFHFVSPPKARIQMLEFPQHGGQSSTTITRLLHLFVARRQCAPQSPFTHIPTGPQPSYEFDFHHRSQTGASATTSSYWFYVPSVYPPYLATKRTPSSNSLLDQRIRRDMATFALSSIICPTIPR